MTFNVSSHGSSSDSITNKENTVLSLFFNGYSDSTPRDSRTYNLLLGDGAAGVGGGDGRGALLGVPRSPLSL